MTLSIDHSGTEPEKSNAPPVSGDLSREDSKNGLDTTRGYGSGSGSGSGLGSGLEEASKHQRVYGSLERLFGFETRGITRVLPEDRDAPSIAKDIQIALLWFSANISCNNLIVGLYGPLLFELGFLDCAMCAVFGALLGSLSTAYMATWGPKTGNRTMVVMRFFFGWWPAKLPTFLNIVLMVGYCTVDGILGGQILSAVSGGTMTILVGIIVVNVSCAFIVILGMRPFQEYERFAWIPQLLVLLILIGCAGPSFNTSTVSVGGPATIAANRLSFLSLCLYVPNSWTGAAADFYVYYPEQTKPLKVALLTIGGLWVGFSLVFMIGIGLGTGIATNDAWASAYDTSIGALIVAGFEPLHGFGKFCAVIVALGLISNSVPGTYSATMCAQVLGRYFEALPRWAWACVFIVIELAIGLGGRNSLYTILSNFLALMGYWIEFMILIVIMERFIFRRDYTYDWARWKDRSYMPVGIAACISFLLGWLGAVLGMYQTYFTGPLATLANTSDVGLWVGMGFTLISYPPLRYLELRLLHR